MNDFIIVDSFNQVLECNIIIEFFINTELVDA